MSETSQVQSHTTLFEFPSWVADVESLQYYHKKIHAFCISSLFLFELLIKNQLKTKKCEGGWIISLTLAEAKAFTGQLLRCKSGPLPGSVENTLFSLPSLWKEILIFLFLFVPRKPLILIWKQQSWWKFAWRTKNQTSLPNPYLFLKNQNELIWLKSPSYGKLVTLLYLNRGIPTRIPILWAFFPNRSYSWWIQVFLVPPKPPSSLLQRNKSIKVWVFCFHYRDIWYNIIIFLLWFRDSLQYPTNP